jgi:hypothetical protein
MPAAKNKKITSNFAVRSVTLCHIRSTDQTSAMTVVPLQSIPFTCLVMYGLFTAPARSPDHVTSNCSMTGKQWLIKNAAWGGRSLTWRKSRILAWRYSIKQRKSLGSKYSHFYEHTMKPGTLEQVRVLSTWYRCSVSTIKLILLGSRLYFPRGLPLPALPNKS